MKADSQNKQYHIDDTVDGQHFCCREKPDQGSADKSSNHKSHQGNKQIESGCFLTHTGHFIREPDKKTAHTSLGADIKKLGKHPKHEILFFKYRTFDFKRTIYICDLW